MEETEYSMAKYDKIRPMLRTGDVILFKDSGASSVISFLQKKKRLRGTYTHVGIVIMSKSFPVGSQYRLCSLNGVDYANVPYIFESTQSGIGGDGTVSVSGRKMLGVQLRKLDDVVFSYGSKKKTRIVVGKLRKKYKLDDEQVYNSFLKYNMTRYQLNCVQLLSTIFDFLKRFRSFFDVGIFCSELVALMLKESGVINNEVNPKDCLPIDFFLQKGAFENLFSHFIEIESRKIEQKNKVNCLGF
jgi:hypothetical protein